LRQWSRWSLSNLAVQFHQLSRLLRWIP
jgi:hypothetical protein